MPYSRLFVGSEKVVAVSGSRIYLLSSATGDVIASHPNVASNEGRISKQGLIVAAVVNEAFTYLLTVGENKMMQLWRLPQLDLINERELPKRPTSLAFTKDNQTILVSDKFGDIFSYAFDFTPPTTELIPDEFASHENPSDGKLILGHASPLTAFSLSQDEKYIITADRDEHIRVSCYPQGYNIEMYCLGHCKYVSAIHLPTFSPDILISGGGDPHLKIWNWISGECIGEIQIWDSVEPFIVVKNVKGKRAGDEGSGEGIVPQKRKGKGKKSRRRGKKHSGKVETESIVEAQSHEEGGQDDDDANEQEEESSANITEEKVLVVNKIASLRCQSNNFLLFSAVGATALFAFHHPKGPVQNFNFGHPVIDFTIDQDEKIWVSLDTTISASESEQSKDDRLVRVVQIDENSKLAKISHSQQNQTLLTNLNETCGNSDSLDKSVDFYADLKGMPKWSEPSSNKEEPDTKESTPSDFPTTTTTTTTTTTATATTSRRKELRMKNKQNVLAKMQSTKNQSEGSTPALVNETEKEKVGTVRPLAEVEGVDVDEGEREAKRAKSMIQDDNFEMSS